MKKLNYNTKKAKTFVNAWKDSVCYNLYDAYEKPSSVKAKAYRKIFEEFINTDNSIALKIISHNTWRYTVAYAIFEGYSDNYKALIVHTPKNVYYIELEDDLND